MDTILDNTSLPKGIIYYTLTSCYPGDYTKNCGLLGTEIDNNFYFLRGHDIKDFSIENDASGKKTLKLTRYDGEVLKGEIASDDVTDKFTFEFNQDKGIITITYPSGKKVELSKFNTLKVSSKDTIKGNGSIESPLHISEVERTGTYSPANELVDITENSVMPDGTKYGKGYRIVTKENVTKYGLLYNYFEVQKISKALETSPWRVPTKDDWDEMLNAIEPCESGQTHQDLGNRALGMDAGALLKQSGTTIWRLSKNPEDVGEDAYGFTALPLGFAGSRAGFLVDEDKDIEGYHVCTNFWTNTLAGLVDSGSTGDSVYTKALWFKTRKVVQEALAKNSRLSLRLVKDYDGNNFNAYEEILGSFYPCIHINASSGKFTHNKIWTAVNIGLNAFGGVPSPEWNELWYTEISSLPEGIEAVEYESMPSATEKSDKYIKVGDKYYTLIGNIYTQNYFINEWNGTEWVKKMMNDGDSIVILNYPNKDGETLINHEWRIYRQSDGNDELIDTIDALREEIKDDENEIKELINALSGSVEATINTLSGNVDTAINALSGSVEATINTLSGNVDTAINTLSGNTYAFVTETSGNIQSTIIALSENIEDTITILSGNIKNTIYEVSGNVEDTIIELSGNMANSINSIKSDIDSISGTVQDMYNELSEKISNSADEITSYMNEVSGNIENTIASLSGNVESTILKESQERKENDLQPKDYLIGNQNEKIDVLNNKGEKVISITFDGNFGKIIIK